ncbi:MAG: anhydro-N-acetylmuramic acid kinase, partial [Gemmataceae bacterium]|nr:anhydro-N-acetylmuramic acid kinase [Gemmataceae bacterium]
PAADLTRAVADTAVQAARVVLAQAGASAREVFAAGLLDPARPRGEAVLPWAEVADRLAEQTGLTVVHAFRGRDRAAGGSGHLITALADYLLFRHESEDRLLVHLGAVAGVVFVPAGGKVSAAVGFEAGPGNALLDALAYHGTRGREPTDPGGRTAVQGRVRDELLDRWLDHPYFGRKPPKAVPADAFGRGFLLAAFDAARRAGAGLPDLLCSATHLVARAVGGACRQWLPPAAGPRRVFLSGGGTRNGLLLQLVQGQFDGLPVARSDEAGVPPLGRNAAGAAVLAGLTADGVAGNLPLVTGAAGGRLVGQVVPGDGRGWPRWAAWAADQTGDTPRVTRAA